MIAIILDIARCRLYKVNKRTQELIQSDPHKAPNIKEKDRQIQQSSHKMNKWQAELESLSPKRWNSVTQS